MTLDYKHPARRAPRWVPLVRGLILVVVLGALLGLLSLRATVDVREYLRTDAVSPAGEP